MSPRGQRSGDWTPEMRAKISQSRKGKPGHKQTTESREKIGEGARNTRNSEKKHCPYPKCLLVTNHGALKRHIAKQHTFLCAVDGCTPGKIHKARGLCAMHWAIDMKCKKYGMTVHQFVLAFHKQSGRCKICDRPMILSISMNGTRSDVAVLDHCHTKNTFRGIICQSCNLALGHVKDRVDVLRRMINYLNGDLR